MTEPLEVNVIDALYAWLTSSAPPLSATPRAAPLVAYSPAPGTLYLDVRPLLRAEPQDFGLDHCAVLDRGIFQIDVVAPDGAGQNPALRLAALIKSRFAVGTKLVAGGYRLEITKTPTIAAAVKDAPWVRFPVSIPFLVIH